MKNNIYQHKQLQERQGASPALTSSVPAKSDEFSSSKLSVACRGEKTPGSGRMNVINYTVFLERNVRLSPPQGEPCGFRRT